MGRGPTSQVRVLNQLSIIFGYDCKGIDDYGGCPGILPHGYLSMVLMLRSITAKCLFSIDKGQQLFGSLLIDKPIKRAEYADTPAVQDVGVYLRRANVLVPQ